MFRDSKNTKRYSAEILKATTSSVAKISANTRWASSQVAQLFNAALATNAATEVDRYLRGVFETAPTAYDKAMDYGRQLMNEKGYDHRLFDGGHSITGAWEAVKSAKVSDSLGEEGLGFLKSYWKDLVTPMGMPITTLNRDNFEAISQVADKLGIERQWLLDLASFTATETLGTFAAVLGASMNWNKNEIEEFAKLASGLTTSAALAANPLAMTVALLLVARTIHKGRKRGKLKSIFKSFGWGAAKSGAFIGTASIVGGGAWVGIGCGVMAAFIVHKMSPSNAKDKNAYDTNHMSNIMLPMLQREVLPLIRDENKKAQT